MIYLNSIILMKNQDKMQIVKIYPLESDHGLTYDVLVYEKEIYVEKGCGAIHPHSNFNFKVFIDSMQAKCHLCPTR